MGDSGVRGKRSVMGLAKASLADKDHLVDVCKMCFAELPSSPNGEVLSRKGARKAVESATRHYSTELLRYNASPKSSLINTALKDVSAAAEKASACLIEANAQLKILNDLLNGLGEDSIRRVGSVPSPILQILDESKSAKSGLMHRRYKKAILALGGAELSEDDHHVLRSEIFCFFASKRKNAYAAVLDEELIPRINSLKTVFARAATREGVGNPKGGPKRTFQETGLFPSYQLVEACMAILQAARIPMGTARKGVLEELTTAIRMSVEGKDAPALTRAIEDLPAKTKGQAKRLKERLDYWSLGLLLQDLRSIPKPDVKTSAKMSELEARLEIFHALLCRDAVLKPIQRSGERGFAIEYGPLKDIDQESPFR